MQCNSLKDLLEILGNICEIQKTDHLNRRIKHFEYFRFTFFGLIERVKTILGYTIYKGEFLKQNYNELEEIYSELKHLQQKVFEVNDLVKKKDMKNGQEKIIEISKDYSIIFKEINKLIERYF